VRKKTDEHTHACTLLSTQAVVEVTDEHMHARTLLSTQAVVEVTDEHTLFCPHRLWWK
jgi:hypothetical protein